MLQGLELSVAILMDDLACAKEIAGALRHVGILAHHFQTLEEFWVAAKLQTPDLLIIDVTKTGQGGIQFRNHPKVIDGSLSFVIFSKDTTKILLQSTVGLSAAGHLHYDSTLGAQVMNLVKNRARELKLQRDLKEAEARVQRLQSRSQRLISERSAAEEFRSNFDMIYGICASIEEDSTRQDFTASLLNKLEVWESIEGQGLYELHQNGQKLVSPESPRRNYHPFPSLWLGQTNENGIENFAQDMAQQVANDLFESEPIMIKIHAGGKNPELLLFVSFKEERMTGFPWDVFESMLSSSYRKVKLNLQAPKYASQFLPMWEALDNMDRMQKMTTEGDSRIIALSLIPLVDVVKRRTQNKFYWSSFFNDFFLQLSGRVLKTTRLSTMGPWHVIFFIPKEDLERETQALQTFVRQFGYWKFFEDNSQVLTEDMLPILKLVPPSSSHYLRVFEKEFEELAQSSGRTLPPMVSSKRLTV
jgi:DNA-binding NarL/FixJ family response regulator